MKISDLILTSAVRVKIVETGKDCYSGLAFDGLYGVYNCFGSTPEKAKELTLFRLKNCYENKDETQV